MDSLKREFIAFGPGSAGAKEKRSPDFDLTGSQSQEPKLIVFLLFYDQLFSSRKPCCKAGFKESKGQNETN